MVKKDSFQCAWHVCASWAVQIPGILCACPLYICVGKTFWGTTKEPGGNHVQTVVRPLLEASLVTKPTFHADLILWYINNFLCLNVLTHKWSQSCTPSYPSFHVRRTCSRIGSSTQAFSRCSTCRFSGCLDMWKSCDMHVMCMWCECDVHVLEVLFLHYILVSCWYMLCIYIYVCMHACMHACIL